MTNKIIYVDRLVGMVYKILPLYEEINNDMPWEYIENVISDIISADDCLFDGRLVEIRVKLNSFKQLRNQKHKRVRSIVLECTSILDCIRKELILERSGVNAC